MSPDHSTPDDYLAYADDKDEYADNFTILTSILANGQRVLISRSTVDKVVRVLRSCNSSNRTRFEEFYGHYLDPGNLKLKLPLQTQNFDVEFHHNVIDELWRHGPEAFDAYSSLFSEVGRVTGLRSKGHVQLFSGNPKEAARQWKKWIKRQQNGKHLVLSNDDELTPAQKAEAKRLKGLQRDIVVGQKGLAAERRELDAKIKADAVKFAQTWNDFEHDMIAGYEELCAEQAAFEKEKLHWTATQWNGNSKKRKIEALDEAWPEPGIQQKKHCADSSFGEGNDNSPHASSVVPNWPLLFVNGLPVTQVNANASHAIYGFLEHDLRYRLISNLGLPMLYVDTEQSRPLTVVFSYGNQARYHFAGDICFDVNWDFGTYCVNIVRGWVVDPTW